jgi:hypothetical protein
MSITYRADSIGGQPLLTLASYCSPRSRFIIDTTALNLHPIPREYTSTSEYSTCCSWLLMKEVITLRQIVEILYVTKFVRTVNKRVIHLESNPSTYITTAIPTWYQVEHGSSLGNAWRDRLHGRSKASHGIYLYDVTAVPEFDRWAPPYVQAEV